MPIWRLECPTYNSYLLELLKYKFMYYFFIKNNDNGGGGSITSNSSYLYYLHYQQQKYPVKATLYLTAVLKHISC